MSLIDKNNETMIKLANAHHMMEVNGMPFIALPDGYKLHDLSDALPHPSRIQTQIEMQDFDSFIAYTEKHKTDKSIVMVNENKRSFTAIMDYHDKDNNAAWQDHKATYRITLSKPWITWESRNNQKLTQVEFAEFLEERASDIVEPHGTELLEIALKFNVVRKATFGSATRLQTGEFQFTYHQENEEKGTIELPETITLGIAPFHNGTAYELKARLRYRLVDGVLSFYYKLIDPEKCIEDAMNELIEKSKKALPKTDLFKGSI